MKVDIEVQVEKEVEMKMGKSGSRNERGTVNQKKWKGKWEQIHKIDLYEKFIESIDIDRWKFFFYNLFLFVG